MKRIYANYCVLVSTDVPDETTDEEVKAIVEQLYADRGFNFGDFDDGEYEVIKVGED